MSACEKGKQWQQALSPSTVWPIRLATVHDGVLLLWLSFRLAAGFHVGWRGGHAVAAIAVIFNYLAEAYGCRS